MYGLRRFGIKLGLSTIRSILYGLGNPQNQFKCIHVAGTNGKGSIASTLSSILQLSGYKVGLYTSPHLVRFNERICINQKPIDDDSIVTSYEAVNRADHGDREPTFFEFTTAMALYEFGKQKVDWAIIETGMGGRLDATNIITPALCVISNISVEHREYLGNTITEIAGEKAGIIKKQVPVVTGVKQKNAISVVEKIAKNRSAPLYRLGQHFKTRKGKDGTFTYFGIDHTKHKMKTGLSGTHQIQNAALAIAASEILMNNEAVKVSYASIKEGLIKNKWPGRLEIVSLSPTIILDGAHNLIAARNLAKFLKEEMAGRHITLVIGILDDKPYASMLQSLLSACDRVVLTRPVIDRALAPETLLPQAKDLVKDTTVINDVGEALMHAAKTSQPEDVICVAGSLYVVGEAKQMLEKHPEFLNLDIDEQIH